MRNKLFVSVLLLSLFSCTKEHHISTADFTVDNEVVYIGQQVTVKATDETEDTDYKFDFGDGNIITSGPSSTHEYYSPDSTQLL